MIEINTIQDIRHIESKLIGDFSGRQLISFTLGIVVGGVVFLITKTLFFALLIGVLVIALGVIKIGNLTSIEYLKLVMDKERQPRVRVYKNKNLINLVEQQCKNYKSPKKRR